MGKKRNAAPRTNAMRTLDRAKIPYAVRTYTVDESDLSATTVAAKIGMPAERVFKTLCGVGDKTGPLFAVVGANQTVDLKALARASGNRSVSFVPLKQLRDMTGYIRGGVTVFAAKKAFPVFVDTALQTSAEIAVSAGMRGAQLVLTGEAYIRAAQATVAPLVVQAAPATVDSDAGA